MIHYHDYCPKDFIYVFTHNIVVCGVNIFGCSKSSKAIFEDKNPEWITGSNQDIYPEIKFEPVNEKWLKETNKIETSYMTYLII